MNPQTVAELKKFSQSEWCLCIDINLCLNRESITHFGRKPMTRLIKTKQTAI